LDGIPGHFAVQLGLFTLITASWIDWCAASGPLKLPPGLDHRELLFRHVIKKGLGFSDLSPNELSGNSAVGFPVSSIVPLVTS
jgi:hypothetical protein